MSGRREQWGWRDSRNGQRMSITTCHSREYAERTLAGWLARDARGKRPDLHDVLPHVEVFRVWPPEEAGGVERVVAEEPGEWEREQG